MTSLASWRNHSGSNMKDETVETEGWRLVRRLTEIQAREEGMDDPDNRKGESGMLELYKVEGLSLMPFDGVEWGEKSDKLQCSISST